jgi:hypothetical protein
LVTACCPRPGLPPPSLGEGRGPGRGALLSFPPLAVAKGGVCGRLHAAGFVGRLSTPLFTRRY